MTTAEIEQVAKALLLLRQSNARHIAGDNENAIALERQARGVLADLLNAAGVEVDAPCPTCKPSC